MVLVPERWPFTVGCVSDTHIPQRARHLPGELFEALEGADLIVHAGDLVTSDVLAELEPLARVEAVAGNMDPESLPAGLGRTALIEIGPWRIGLVHGDRGPGSTTPERALATFEGLGVDVIVFGHTHRPLVEIREGILLVNPGSPTDCRAAPWPSFGLLTLPGPVKSRPPAGDVRRLKRPASGFRG